MAKFRVKGRNYKGKGVVKRYANSSKFQKKKFIKKTMGSLVPTKEIKYLDLLQMNFGPGESPVYNANNAFALGTNSGMWALNLIQEGTSLYNRVGRKIVMHSLYLKLTLQAVASTYTSYRDHVRVQIVYDKQTNGSAPLYTDIVKGYSNTGSSTSDIYDGLNPDNKFRFEILYDEVFQVPALTTASGALGEFGVTFATMDTGNGQGGNTAVIKKFIDLKRRVTQYKSTTNPANVGDIATGGLFLVIWNQSNGNANNANGNLQWVMPGSTRLRFEDL